MKKLSKYWFVCLLSLIFIGITSYFVYDTNKGKLKGKTSNGQQIVYSINGIDTSADDLYEKIYQRSGISGIYAKIEQIVAAKSVETTDEMVSLAKLNAENIISRYQANYGSTYEAQILSALRQYGYSDISDLETYLVQVQKVTQILNEYVQANPDLATKYIEESKPRLVSHILVSMADPENPSQEEEDKMKAIEEELASGKDFNEVASSLSDDTGSATNGGSIGLVNKDSSLVPEFLEAMLQLNTNETSQWVKTQFGYHLIKVVASTYDELKDLDEFNTSLYAYDTSIQARAIYAKAEELGISFANEEIKTELLKYLGITDSVE